MQFLPNEEFQRLWRSAAVADMDDAKIEEYLYKTGFAVNAGQARWHTLEFSWLSLNSRGVSLVSLWRMNCKDFPTHTSGCIFVVMR